MLSDHRYGLASSASNVLGGQRMSKSAPCSPIKPLIKRAPARADSFHVIHKVPVGDSPYVRAKHVQLVDKDPERAIALFWAAINAGDRVDSALKDMAIVMKQQNRPEEAIEAIKSLRSRCSDQSQESLDNVLLDLYKRCGRLDDQIALLKHKLHLIHQGLAFNGKRTKTARSQGKKFQVSIEQEATRLLGNLGWAYMQQSNYAAAEAVYRKALSIEPDNNKVCNLGICLMKQGRLEEAKLMLQSVTPASTDSRWGSDSHLKSYERAQEMLRELENSTGSAAMELGPRASGFGGSEHTQNNNASNIYLQTAGFGPSSDGVFNRPFHPKNGAESFCDQIKQQKLAQFMPGYVDSWEDDDSEFLSADENQHINLQGGSAAQQASSQQMKMHAEMLRQKLESISKMAGMGNGKLLNSAALPFTLNSSNLGPKQGLEDRNKGFEFKVPAPKCMNNFSRSENNGNVHANGNGNGNGNASAWNRVSGMGGDENSKRPTRRSLSMESFESSFNPVVVPPSNCGNAGLPPRISKTPPKIPNREKALLPSLSSWGELGFISSPRALDFTCVDSVVGNVVPEVQSAAAALESISMTESPKTVLSSIEQEMKCQRRLRVFQEITLA